jgi:hypothetical protein
VAINVDLLHNAFSGGGRGARVARGPITYPTAPVGLSFAQLPDRRP